MMEFIYNVLAVTPFVVLIWIVIRKIAIGICELFRDEFAYRFGREILILAACVVGGTVSGMLLFWYLMWAATYIVKMIG